MTMVATPHTFTREEMARGGRAGTAELAAQRERKAAVAYEATRLADSVEEGRIGLSTLRAALRGSDRLLDAIEVMPIETPLDLQRVSSVVKDLYLIHRLATGQSTSNAAHATVDPGALEDRAALLSQRLASLQGPTPATGASPSPQSD